ncbi:MAG TPA: ABC transporter permease [Gemmatimonadaceae bacterium]
MTVLRQDIRLALRLLRRAPGFTAVAVLTLALAIAATTTIFGVVDAVIIRPLPFADPGRLVRIQETTPHGEVFTASEPDYLDFAAQNRTLSGLAAFKPADAVLTGAGEPLRLHAVAASANLYPLLGVRPAIGRGFALDEDLPDEPSSVVVLSHALWRSRFGGDSGIVGRPITIDGRAHTVIGVMPATFRYPEADAYLPLHASARSDRTDHWLELVGRLRPATTAGAAEADLARVARGIGAINATSVGWSVRLGPLSHALVDDAFRRAGWVLLAATGVLLLLACANVANLLLARATTRQAELGIRAAIGASDSRLVRQLFTESAVLVAIAGVIGLVGAGWGIAAVHAFGAARIPRLDEVTLDARVVLAALGVSVLTGLGCGLAPALRAARLDPASALAEGGARAGVARRHRRVRDALVVLQIALSTVLLVSAGLLLRSFARLSNLHTGFDAAHAVAVNVSVPPGRYDEAQQVLFFDRLTERLRALPSVRAVGATAVDPFSGWNLVNDVTPEDRAAVAPATGYMQAGWRSVTPAFFAAMGIPLVRGRVFDESDGPNAPPVAIVSGRLAHAMWPDEDAVGKRLYWGGTTGTPRTIVGVVGDIRDVAPERDAEPMLFLPHAQVAMPSMTIVVRTDGPADVMAGVVRDAIQQLDPLLPVPSVHPLAQNLDAALAVPRFHVLLMGTFAALALALGASGISAVIAFNIARRRHEIGICLAIGADQSTIVASFVKSGLSLASVGLAVGLLGSWAATRFLRGLLYGVAPDDALTFIVVAAVLGTVALLASGIPARRAARVSPTDALRAE